MYFKKYGTLRRFAKTAVTLFDMRGIRIRENKNAESGFRDPPPAHFFLPPRYERVSCGASACRQSETDSRTAGTRVAPPLLQIGGRLAALRLKYGGRLAALRLQIGGRLAAIRSPTVSVSAWRRYQGAWRVLSPSSNKSSKKEEKK
jgi:hypothetical protein